VKCGEAGRDDEESVRTSGTVKIQNGEFWVLGHLGRLDDSFRGLHECPPYMGEKVTRNVDEMQA
jgi:hypothetical protein